MRRILGNSFNLNESRKDNKLVLHSQWINKYVQFSVFKKGGRLTLSLTLVCVAQSKVYHLTGYTSDRSFDKSPLVLEIVHEFNPPYLTMVGNFVAVMLSV